MRTISPDMKLDKQIRKGLAVVNSALDQGNIQMASYAARLVADMITSAVNGMPRPWSEFSPMINEEFDD